MIFSMHSLSFASFVPIATALAGEMLGGTAGLLLLAMVSGAGFTVLLVVLTGIGLQPGDEGWRRQPDAGRIMVPFPARRRRGRAL